MKETVEELMELVQKFGMEMREIRHSNKLANIRAYATRLSGQVGEPVGVAGTMPGTDGFTMACFKAADVPLGTRLYASTPPALPLPEPSYEALAKLLEEERAKNMDIACILLDQNREEAKDWARGIHTDFRSAWTEAATPQAGSSNPAGMTEAQKETLLGLIKQVCPTDAASQPQAQAAVGEPLSPDEREALRQRVMSEAWSLNRRLNDQLKQIFKDRPHD